MSIVSMESAGERLKKIRLEKGLSLEEVQKKTRIHLNILKAIEGESVSNLNPIYLKSFLRIYCKFLEVDPKDFIPDYKETQSPIKKAAPEPEKKPIAAPPKSASFIKAMPGRPSPIKLEAHSPKKGFKKIIILAAVFIAICIGLFYLGKVIFAKRVPVAVKQTTAAPVKKQGKKVQVAQKPKSAATTTTIVRPKLTQTTLPPKPLESGIRLSIKAKENCWVTLKSDGRVVFQRVLEKGRSETWKAKEKMELSLGNAGAVELQVNGQVFSNLGRRGQPLKNILITKDGLNISR